MKIKKIALYLLHHPHQSHMTKISLMIKSISISANIRPIKLYWSMLRMVQVRAIAQLSHLRHHHIKYVHDQIVTNEIRRMSARHSICISIGEEKRNDFFNQKWLWFDQLNDHQHDIRGFLFLLIRRVLHVRLGRQHRVTLVAVTLIEHWHLVIWMKRRIWAIWREVLLIAQLRQLNHHNFIVQVIIAFIFLITPALFTCSFSFC